MVTMPAWVWRGGGVRRVVVIGTGAGFFFGIVAWLDSGVPFVGGIVFVVAGTFYGIWMARRMTRFWPQALELTGDERVAVVAAVRRGEPVDDGRLARAAADYGRGMRAAADQARPLRWVLIVVLVAALATAGWDAVWGSWGNLLASAVYLVALLAEMFWWPRRQARLLCRIRAV